MKKIRPKLMTGILSIFLVAFIVILINIGANQTVLNKSHSLLKNNYPSVKYTFEMLRLIERVNAELLFFHHSISDSIPAETNLLAIKEYLSEFDNNLKLQMNNITEPGEKELSESLKKALFRFKQSISKMEFENDLNAYQEKYFNLREYILNIHDMNISLLETKNEEIEKSAIRVLSLQKNVGIIGLTILAIFILIIPLILLNPIHKLTERMINFYRTNFNKEIVIESAHELEKLEEIFEKIVLESRSNNRTKEE